MGSRKEAAKKAVWERRWGLYVSFGAIPLIAVYHVLRDGGGAEDVAVAVVVSTITTAVISLPFMFVIHRWAGPGRARRRNLD